MTSTTTFRAWLDAGGRELRSKRVSRTRSWPNCSRRGGHLIGFPCGRCDRAEAVDEELARRADVDPTDDAGYMRGECARLAEYVAQERRAWRRNRLRGVSDAGLRPMGEWGRELIARMAWYRGHAAFPVLP